MYINMILFAFLVGMICGCISMGVTYLVHKFYRKRKYHFKHFEESHLEANASLLKSDRVEHSAEHF